MMKILQIIILLLYHTSYAYNPAIDHDSTALDKHANDPSRHTLFFNPNAKMMRDGILYLEMNGMLFVSQYTQQKMNGEVKVDISPVNMFEISTEMVRIGNREESPPFIIFLKYTPLDQNMTAFSVAACHRAVYNGYSSGAFALLTIYGSVCEGTIGAGIGKASGEDEIIGGFPLFAGIQFHMFQNLSLIIDASNVTSGCAILRYYYDKFTVQGGYAGLDESGFVLLGAAVLL